MSYPAMSLQGNAPYDPALMQPSPQMSHSSLSPRPGSSAGMVDVNGSTSPLPTTAFTGITSLTLLALDGNPMASLPEEAFSHLNSSLRGLSLGGRFLTCDCRVRWVAQWIQDLDLQVTSRERNPQFCGNPLSLRERSFYQLNPKGK